MATFDLNTLNHHGDDEQAQEKLREVCDDLAERVCDKIPDDLTGAEADVTVHGTLGMLEAQLVTKTFEQVGTVEVWNDRNNMNLRVIPFTDQCLLSKVQVFLSTDPVPPPHRHDD